MRRFLEFALVIGLMTVAVVAVKAVVERAAEREAERREAVEVHNCRYYGAAINQYYGREICPPTPHG